MLKLINTGLGRTGTTSLSVALDRLGFGPCYHMFDVVNSGERLGQWEDVIYGRSRHPDWKAVFDGFTSVVDGPCATYYRQIMEVFPEAKVMLSVRDPERWYRSTYDTLYQVALRGADNVSQAPGEIDSLPSRVQRLADKLTWEGLFGGRFTDKEHAIKVYHEHNQGVIDNIGKDNLLIWDVEQGWDPLCSFLGADVPPEEFPHVNDTESMRRVIDAMFAKGSR